MRPEKREMMWRPMRLSEAHDAGKFEARWLRVARAARMEVNELGTGEGGRVLCLEGRGEGGPGLYLSSGVHGDEAAAAAGLLLWAEARIDYLKRQAVTVVPVFNPAGLRMNTRLDGEGRDLNRMFHLKEDPLMGAWWRVVEGRRYGAAVCLHEDYDAEGCYCYELNEDAGLRLADRLLGSVEEWVPRDGRRTIDGRRADRGVIQRRRVPALPGLPEAVALYRAGVPVTLTFETPSEMEFERRVRAHAAFVEAVAEWVEKIGN